MWAVSTAIWCAILGVVFCATISRESRSDENSFDPVEPQMFNQLLQELIEKDKMPIQKLDDQNQQYQTWLQEQFQSQDNEQFQNQFQNQVKLPQTTNSNEKPNQRIFVIPEKNAYPYSIYQFPASDQYKQAGQPKYQKIIPQQEAVGADFKKTYPSAHPSAQAASKHRHMQAYQLQTSQKIPRGLYKQRFQLGY